MLRPGGRLAAAGDSCWRREEEAAQVSANEVGHGGTGCSTYNELRNTSDQEHISAATLTNLKVL